MIIYIKVYQFLINLQNKTCDIIQTMITQQLIEFSNQHNLWGKTLEHCVTCLQEYIHESLPVDFPQLKDIEIDDFMITRKNQSLVFFQDGRSTFILRTTYNIILEQNGFFIVGSYSLDVDSNGKDVDDWLVME